MKLIEPFKPPCGALHPTGERCPVQTNALAGQDLDLTVQRQIPRELGGDDMGHKGGRGHAALDQAGVNLSLDDAIGAAATGISGTDGP